MLFQLLWGKRTNKGNHRGAHSNIGGAFYLFMVCNPMRLQSKKKDIMYLMSLIGSIFAVFYMW